MTFRKGQKVCITKGRFKGMKGTIIARNVKAVGKNSKTQTFPYLVNVSGAGKLAFKSSELKKCK